MKMTSKVTGRVWVDGILQSLETQPKVEEKNGRWFITIGNPGFNSPANNRSGYKSKMSALAANKMYANKGKRWVRNAMSGKLQLEEIGTPFSASVASESYWCS